MKRLIAMLAMVVVTVTAVSFAGNIKTNLIDLKDDSGAVAVFWIGDSTGVGAKADFDTSIVYDSPLWDDVTIQVKTQPGCYPCGDGGGIDSGAVVVVLQVSNDEVYWTPIDSIQVADSLAAFKDLGWQKYRFARFIMHHHTKTDSSGTRATARINYWGRE